ncbi:MAG: SRPBCC family protein [Xanthomonadales bacterium]|nr:SRPBCC family protein [Xanthomonadales bacterium]
MTRLIEFVIALLLVAVLFVLVGVFLPSHRYVRHSVETNRPVRLVYDLLNGFQRFDEWHPKRMHDPAIRYTMEGEPRGLGAVLRYESDNPKIGTGSLKVTESVQDERIEWAAESPAYGTNKTYVFTLDDRGKTVDINWEYDVDYGWNLFGRYAGLYIDRTVGDDMRLGLTNLTGLLATIPNFNYDNPMVDVQESEVQSQTALILATSADRNITAVEEELDASIRKIRAAIASNGLEAAGPARLITVEFADKKYTFEVAIPVRKPDPAAAAAEATAAAEAPAAEAPAAEAPAAPGAAAAPAAPAVAVAPLEGLNLPEGIVSGVTYGGRVVMTDYAGHPASLPLIRDMLRAYAATHGLNVHDRGYEEYLTEITETAAEDSTFKVYWPIR